LQNDLDFEDVQSRNAGIFLQKALNGEKLRAFIQNEISPTKRAMSRFAIILIAYFY